MKSAFPEKYHRYLYIFSICILAIGLPVSKFLMSLSQIIIICNWVLEGDLKNKWKQFSTNKIAVVLTSFFFLHIIGLLYTSDFNYAINDLRIKLPLLVLPLVISSSKPLSTKEYNIVLCLFISAVLFSTVASTLVLTGVIYKQVIDTRSLSLFISHIRFSLLICVSISMAFYFLIKSVSIIQKILWGLLIFWFITFLVLIESLTGIAALAVVILFGVIWFLFHLQNKLIKVSSLLLLFGTLVIVCIIGVRLILNYSEHKAVDRKELQLYTSHGNLYQHDIYSTSTENGHLIWVNYCIKELEEEWNKRSNIKFADKDLNGNSISFTLIRFLTSKGGSKDADAVKALTDAEIKAIERGAVNVNYQDISSFSGRIHETLWEIDVYRTSGNANGHSLTQRFEYWKTALSIIKENILIGVGTGDVAKAFDEAYIKNNSSLNPERRLRAHNQYLTVAVSFGIIGLLWFLFALLYPLLEKVNRTNIVYIAFLIIAMVSFFTEDTLETQDGVTFYAFLNTLLLFAKEPSDE